MRFCRIYLVLLLSLCSSPLHSTPLDRVVLLGASLGAGFHHTEYSHFFNRPKSDSLALQKALNKELGKSFHAQDLTNRFLSFYPEYQIRKQLRQARKLNPTLIIAPDLLFWSLYGVHPVKGERARLSRLQQTLQAIESFSCPIILGDLPDASASLGPVLRREQVPASTTLKQANSLFQKFSREKANIIPIPLSLIHQNSLQGLVLEVGKLHFTSQQTRQFLQPDHLHPTEKGIHALAKIIHQKMVTAQLVPEKPLPAHERFR